MRMPRSSGREARVHIHIVFELRCRTCNTARHSWAFYVFILFGGGL